jgi:hypothetical protein
MKPLSAAGAALIVLGCLVTCGAASAQTPEPVAAGKATLRQRTGDDLEQRRLTSVEQLAAEAKARKEWELRRRQILEQRAARRADCKREADAQRLHLVKRWRFVKRCVAG